MIPPPLPSYNVDDETKLRQLLELLNSPLVALISPPDISEGDDSSWILPGVHQLITVTRPEIISFQGSTCMLEDGKVSKFSLISMLM